MGVLDDIGKNAGKEVDKYVESNEEKIQQKQTPAS
jgi:hypothetical protein